MNKQQFEIGKSIIFEKHSQMRLEVVPDREIPDDICWISGWFKLDNGKLHIQNFIILDSGRPSYRLVEKAINFWGTAILNISEPDAVMMSPAFAKALLIPAVQEVSGSY